MKKRILPSFLDGIKVTKKPAKDKETKRWVVLHVTLHVLVPAACFMPYDPRRSKPDKPEPSESQSSSSSKTESKAADPKPSRATAAKPETKYKSVAKPAAGGASFYDLQKLCKAVSDASHGKSDLIGKTLLSESKLPDLYVFTKLLLPAIDKRVYNLAEKVLPPRLSFWELLCCVVSGSDQAVCAAVGRE